jgi:hypothetical protein
MRTNDQARISSRVLAASLVIVAGALVSCSPVPKAGNWPVHHTWKTEPQPSDSINVNLFLDASGSMRGFLAHGPDNRYLPVLEQLASVASTGGWNKAVVKWWKFGAHVTEVPAQDHLVMESRDFYSENTTRIDEVFAASSPKDLTVVVTDLFQSRADVELLSGRLIDRYLAGMRQAGAGGPAPISAAVAVLGIQTRFQGRVSELGDEAGRERSVSHDGTLPYYILILGPLADVTRFLQRLDDRFHDLLQHNLLVLFTERPVHQLASSATPGPKRVGFSVEKNLMPGSNGGDERIIQLQVPSMGSKKLPEAGVIEVLLDCNLLHTGLDLNETALRAVVKAETPTADGTFQEDSQLAQALNVQSITLEGKPADMQAWPSPDAGRRSTPHLRVAFELRRDLLRTGHDYRFEVRIFPADNAYRLPPSIQAWSLASTEVDQIVAQNGFTPKGAGRTLNLAVFLENLRDATFNGKELPIGIVYFYVKAT